MESLPPSPLGAVTLGLPYLPCLCPVRIWDMEAEENGPVAEACPFSHSSERTESALLCEMLRRPAQLKRVQFSRNRHDPPGAVSGRWAEGQGPQEGCSPCAGSRRPPGFSSRSEAVALSRGWTLCSRRSVAELLTCGIAMPWHCAISLLGLG